jgi:endoglucanase
MPRYGTPQAQNLFDPLWSTDDPAAGSWFPQQALMLAQLANPALPTHP